MQLIFVILGTFKLTLETFHNIRLLMIYLHKSTYVFNNTDWLEHIGLLKDSWHFSTISDLSMSYNFSAVNRILRSSTCFPNIPFSTLFYTQPTNQFDTITIVKKQSSVSNTIRLLQPIDSQCTLSLPPENIRKP